YFKSGTSEVTDTITCELRVDGALPKIGKVGDECHGKDEEIDYHTETGFVYRMPVSVVVRVHDKENNPLGSQRVQVAQLGPLVALPGTPGGTTSQYTVTFHPITGALKMATLSSAPPDVTGAIGSTGAAAGTLLDAAAARKQREAATANGLVKLQRQAQKLELRLKIRQLESQLDGSTTQEP
ncbi:hypothetical protein LCGC14_1704730, partial [marine sediment metagenome]